MALQSNADLRLLNGLLPVNCIFQSIWLFRGHIDFSGMGSSAPRPTPNLDDQVSIFISPGDWVAQFTPRHRVPISVAFYDMHGLQWDYSFPRSPHGDVNYLLFLKWGSCVRLAEVHERQSSVCDMNLVFEFYKGS
jgi:hypothetical protein